MATKGTKDPVVRLPGERATAPTPLEDASDAAWREFSQLQAPDDSFGDGETQPVRVGELGLRALRPSRGTVTVVSTMLMVRSVNRVCPVDARWAELHALLPLRDGKSAPPPLKSGRGSRTSSIQKRLRLRDQIEWAAATSSLALLHRFLSALPETGWEHFDGD